MIATWTAATPAERTNPELPHKLRLAIAILAATALVIGIAAYGFGYYQLDLDQRVESTLHRELRPSGTIGLKLGMLGVGLFSVLFLYPLRKRWRWLASFGKTKHWLDFHSVVGITAPLVITFHAAFKFEGLAGWAYWIMVAVALSGFIGRYLYTQIPRSLHAIELTAGELDAQIAVLSESLSEQSVFRPDQLAGLLKIPSAQDVKRMPLVTVLGLLLALDLKRPFLVSGLRRRVITGTEWITTLGGFLASRHPELESIIGTVARQARLRTKAAFLDRIRQMFHLWHVIHRPFSISFALLAVIHIGVVISLGYF